MKIDTSKYWKDIEKQDKIIAKLERAIRKKDKKEFEKWVKIVRSENRSKKADWL